jgi:hypothetical protein
MSSIARMNDDLAIDDVAIHANRGIGSVGKEAVLPVEIKQIKDLADSTSLYVCSQALLLSPTDVLDANCILTGLAIATYNAALAFHQMAVACPKNESFGRKAIQLYSACIDLVTEGGNLCSTTTALLAMANNNFAHANLLCCGLTK